MEPLTLHRRNSLTRYLYEKFAPAKLKEGECDLGPYVKALTALCLYAGYDVSIGETSDHLLDRFTAARYQQGIDQEQCRQQRVYIRAVVRHARPGRCPKQPGKRPHEAERVGPGASAWDVEGSLWQFFEATYRPERMAGCSPKAAEQHRMAIGRFCRQHGRPILVAELSDKLVAGHLTWMLAESYSRATANNARGCILANWRLAVRMGFLERLPTVEKLRVNHGLPTAWSIAEVERILAACAETPRKIGDVPACDFWTGLVLLAYDTGLRHRALLAIEQHDLDLETGWLTVPAENQKERNEQRFMLSGQTVDALRRIMRIPGRLLFYWPGNPRQIYYHYDRILRRAKLPHGPRDKLHKLRRTTASHIAAAAGVEAAARQLGHAAVDVTARYIDPQIARREVDGVGYLPRPKRPAFSDDNPVLPFEQPGT